MEVATRSASTSGSTRREKRNTGLKTLHGTERDAKKRCTALLSEIDAGKLLPASKETVLAFINEWFAVASRAFEGRTVLVTRSLIDDYIAKGLGDFSLHRLRTEDVNLHWARMADSGGTRVNGLSPATIRRAHGVLRRALNQAVRWGRIPFNPAEHATLPAMKASTIQPPSQSTVMTILELAQEHDPELALAFAFLAQSGARRGEALGLQWQDVDFDNNKITIQRAISVTHNGIELKGTKTHQARTVALDPSLMARLDAHKNACIQRATTAGAKIQATGFVFSASVDGTEPKRPDSLIRSFRRLCAKAGVPPSRLHDLRHFAATELLSASVDVRTVSGRLGHRNAATTLNVYSHFVPQRDTEAAAVLGSLLPPLHDETTLACGAATHYVPIPS